MRLIDADSLKRSLEFERNLTHKNLTELIDRQPMIDQDKLVAKVNNGQLPKWQGNNVIVYNIEWLFNHSRAEVEALFGKKEGESDAENAE